MAGYFEVVLFTGLLLEIISGRVGLCLEKVGYNAACNIVPKLVKSFPETLIELNTKKYSNEQRKPASVIDIKLTAQDGQITFNVLNFKSDSTKPFFSPSGKFDYGETPQKVLPSSSSNNLDDINNLANLKLVHNPNAKPTLDEKYLNPNKKETHTNKSHRFRRDASNSLLQPLKQTQATETTKERSFNYLKNFSPSPSPVRLVAKTTPVADEHDVYSISSPFPELSHPTTDKRLGPPAYRFRTKNESDILHGEVIATTKSSIDPSKIINNITNSNLNSVDGASTEGIVNTNFDPEDELETAQTTDPISVTSKFEDVFYDDGNTKSRLTNTDDSAGSTKGLYNKDATNQITNKSGTTMANIEDKKSPSPSSTDMPTCIEHQVEEFSGAPTAEYASSEFNTVTQLETETEKITRQSTTEGYFTGSASTDFVKLSVTDLLIQAPTSGILRPSTADFSESASTKNYTLITTAESYAVVGNEEELSTTELLRPQEKTTVGELSEVTQEEFPEQIPTLRTSEPSLADKISDFNNVTQKYFETVTNNGFTRESTSTTSSISLITPTIVPVTHPTETELGETSLTSTTTAKTQVTTSITRTTLSEMFTASSVTNSPRIQESTLLENSFSTTPTATSSSSMQSSTYHHSTTESSEFIEDMKSTSTSTSVEEPDISNSSPTIPPSTTMSPFSYTETEMNYKPSVPTTSQLLLKNPSTEASSTPFTSLFSVSSSITTSGNQPESRTHSTFTFSNKLSRTEESTSKLPLSSTVISLPLVTAGLTDPQTLSLSTLSPFSTVVDTQKSSTTTLVQNSLSTFQTNTPTLEQTSQSASSSLSPELTTISEVDKPAGDNPNATIGNGESISNTRGTTTEEVTIQNLPSSYASLEKKDDPTATSTMGTIVAAFSDNTIIPSLTTSSWIDVGTTDSLMNTPLGTTKSSLEQLFTSSTPSSSSSSQLAYTYSTSESFPPRSSSTIVFHTLRSEDDLLARSSPAPPFFHSGLPMKRTTREINQQTIYNTVMTASTQIDLTTLSPSGVTDEPENTLNDETSDDPLERSTQVVIDLTHLNEKPFTESSFVTMEPTLPTSEMSSSSLSSETSSIETTPISTPTTIQTSTISLLTSGIISDETLPSSTTLFTLASSEMQMNSNEDDGNQKDMNEGTTPSDKHDDLTYRTERTNSFTFTGTMPNMSIENYVGTDTSGYFSTDRTDTLLLSTDATPPPTTTGGVSETPQITMTATTPLVKIEFEETTPTSLTPMEKSTEGTTELKSTTEGNTEPIKANEEGWTSVPTGTKSIESSTTSVMETTPEVTNAQEETVLTTSILPLTSMTFSTMMLGSSYPLIGTSEFVTEETLSTENTAMGESSTQAQEVAPSTMIGTTNTEFNFRTSSESESRSSSGLSENEVTSTPMPMPTETPTMISTSTYQSTSTGIEEEVEDKICDEGIWLECDSIRFQCKCRAGMVYSEESNMCLSLEGQECQFGGTGNRLCVRNAQCFPSRIGEIGKCKCKEGFLATEQGICLPGLGSGCTKDFIEDFNNRTDVTKNDNETGNDGKGNKTDSESIQGTMCHPDLTCSSDKKCMCKPGFSEGKPGSLSCKLDFGEKCSPAVINTCNSFLYLNCSSTEGSCKCQNGDKMMYDVEQKLCVGIAGSKCTKKEDLDGRLLPCTKNSKCKPPNQNDGVEGICECDDGFENDWRGFCHLKNSQVLIHRRSWSLLVLMLIFMIL